MVVDLGRDLAHTFARKEKVLVAAPWLTLLDHATSPYARPRTPEEFCGHLGHHRAVFSGSDADHPIAPAVKLYEERARRARGGGSGEEAEAPSLLLRYEEHATALFGHADVVDWSELKWAGKLKKCALPTLSSRSRPRARGARSRWRRDEAEGPPLSRARARARALRARGTRRSSRAAA